MIEVHGAEQLVELSARLKQAGDKTLQRKLYAAITKAMKPVRAEASKSLYNVTPKRGGLADLKRRQVKYRTSRRASGREPGLKFTASGGQVRRMDAKGEFRHPVFHPNVPWQEQKVTAGWFTRPVEAAAPAVRVDVVRALDDVARELNK